MATSNPYPPGTPEWTNWNYMHLTAGAGSNEAQNNVTSSSGIDVNNHNPIFQIARFLGPSLYQSLLNQTLFSNSLQPIQQSSANQALALLMNPDAMTGQYRAKVNAQAGSATQNVLQRLRSGGAGIGAQQGAALNAQNQATSAGNQFQAYQDSAEGIGDRLSRMLGLITSQQPNLDTAMNLNSITQMTPRGQSGLNTALAGISSLGSLGGSGGFSSLFGGKK